jgi:peptidoglycan/xylan/chitin deacetylase (PgdA/CDA1 family)
MQPILRISAEYVISLWEKTLLQIYKKKKINCLKVPILMYHHIDNCYRNNQLYIDLKTFHAQMEYLKKNCYKTIHLYSLEKLVINNQIIHKQNISITFDDGNLDYFEKAFPVLKKYKLKSTIFITTDWLNKKYYLSKNILKKLTDSELVEFGSHTKTHPDLSKISTHEIKKELYYSKYILEKITNRKINILAYPFGRYNLKVMNIAKEVGYKLAVTTDFGSLHIQRKLLQLKRIRLGGQLTMKDFIRRIKLF